MALERSFGSLPLIAKFVLDLPMTDLERMICESEIDRGLPADWEHVFHALVSVGWAPPSDDQPIVLFQDIRGPLRGLSVVSEEELRKPRLVQEPASRCSPTPEHLFSWRRSTMRARMRA